MGRTKPGGGASTRIGVPGDRGVLRRRPRGRHEARPSVAQWMATVIRPGRPLIGVAILVAVIMCIPSITSEARDETPDAAFDARPRASRKTDDPAPPVLCPIDWRQSTQHLKKLIRCAASHYGVDEDEALYIAWRESRYQPYAYNEEGEAAGIYQHLLKYWPERSVEFGAADWSVFDARANILVTMQMVRRYGWEPWSL
jgi:soluble lytic murein transglycosylase-like protein